MTGLAPHTVINFDNYGTDDKPLGHVFFADGTQTLYSHSLGIVPPLGMPQAYIEAAQRRLDDAMPGWFTPRD